MISGLIVVLIMRRAPVPYAMAYVTLAEGPRMVTNIVDCDFDRLKCEQAVKLVTEEARRHSR